MKDTTRLTLAGRDPEANFGIVNPPVYHASTVVFPTLDALEAANGYSNKEVTYGRLGTPTTRALEDAITELEGGFGTVLAPSGIAAISLALLAVLKAGDHILVSDSVYGPMRQVCDGTLARFGVSVTYYDPLIGGGIARLIRPETRVIYCESPGSLTFEVQDIPAIVAAAKAAGVLTMIDNTWATPLFFKPLALGVDISIHAATKYISGHSDVMAGTVTANEATYPLIRKAVMELGQTLSPDDCYLALRGLRTMAVRLKQHQEHGLALARWLQDRPEVAQVLHPALPQDPGHQLWRRDFTGASGLFGVVLKPCSRPQLAAFVETLRLFGMGYSWGGYESLVVPAKIKGMRSITPWQSEGPLIRFHAGLEAPEDLIADIDGAFAAMAKAS